MLRVHLENRINEYQDKAVHAFFLTKMSYHLYSSRQVCLSLVEIQGPSNAGGRTEYDLAAT
jgi:hypothetical protein